MAAMTGVGLHRVCAALLVVALALINVAPCLCAPATVQSTHCGLKGAAAVGAKHCQSAPRESARVTAAAPRCCCAESEPPPPVAEAVVAAAAAATVHVPQAFAAFSSDLSASAPTSNVRPAPGHSPPLVLRI